MISAADFRAKIAGVRLSKSALRLDNGAEVIGSLLKAGRYRHALEIGTHRGVTAAYMAHFCERVTTIDLEHGRLERYGETFDRTALWQRLGLHNIDLVLLKSDAEKAEAIRSLNFDFAFVDGDHSMPHRDFYLVKRCGAVLLHDYAPGNAVAKLVRSLPPAEVSVMGEFAFWKARMNG